MTDFQKQVKDLIEKGYTVSATSKELKHSMSSISSVIKSLKLTVLDKEYINTVDNEFFDKIDTDEKAYYLGFFIADGNLTYTNRSKGRFSLLIQERDRYLLDNLKNILKCSNEIKIRYNSKGAKNRMPQASLRWTSKPMAETFINTYKILPNKTKDINFKFPIELIPEERLGGFMRGFIDGDGSFEVNTNNSCVFTPRIIGTSKNWLLQVGDIVSKYTGLTKYLEKPKIGKSCTYYILRWSANKINKFEKVKELYNFLYNGAKIFLKRKKDRIEQYLKYRANCENKEFVTV